MTIKKKLVKKSFSRSAQRYEQNAQLQRETARKLADKIETGSYNKILEIGAGTGFLTEFLTEKVPSAKIYCSDLAYGMLDYARGKNISNTYFISADAKILPFKENQFDLLISNFTYQWVINLKAAFSEASRVLSSGGKFYFTSLGPSSLEELKNSYGLAYQSAKGGWPNFLHEFIPAGQIEIALAAAGFRDISIRAEKIRKIYPSAKDLLRALRDIGAVNASQNRPRGLASPTILHEMENIYQQTYRAPGGIWATYEIIWAFASF